MKNNIDNTTDYRPVWSWPPNIRKKKLSI